jgi:hypothetical protein
MPRKIRPKYGIDPVQEVPTFSFTDAQIEHLFNALAPVKGDRGEIITQLESCARDYLWLRKQYQEKPTRAEQNAALKEVGQLARDHGKGLRALAMRLSSLDMDTEWELMTTLPAFDTNDFTNAIANLAVQLKDFAHAAEQVLRTGKKESGPRVQACVQRIVQRLTNLYEAATGKRFTHNPKLKTDYKGRPHSRAGHFIVAFFEIVDCNVKLTSLSTAMASLVKSRRPRQEPAAS